MLLRPANTILLLLLAATSFASDWPQFQHDAARTGRTVDSLPPPYRLRWFWQGTGHVVRNHLSNAAWTGPNIGAPAVIASLATSLPASVDFTLSALMQPITAGSTLFIGDQEGKVYAINAADGAEVWTVSNPGGTMSSGACASNVVIFASLRGDVRAWNASTGALVWSATTKGPITHAPLISGANVIVGSHDRRLSCFALTSGALVWQSPDLGGQVAGGIACDNNAVYAVSENMYANKINLSTGALLARTRIGGKSHYLQHPVVFGGKVYIETSPIPAVGSEDRAADLIAASTSVDDEQDRWGAFMKGQGGYADASPDWRHFSVLNTADMKQAFEVPNGLYEGCGTPPEPPVVDNKDRVLTYWRTKWNYFARDCGWGCPNGTQIDISAINQSTGRRLTIDNGTHDQTWYHWESDNLYAMTVAGNYIYFHQDYRGSQCVNLLTSVGHKIYYQSTETVPGAWADVHFTTGWDDNPPNPEPDYPETPSNSIDGRAGPVVSAGYLYIRCPWGLYCLERRPS